MSYRYITANTISSVGIQLYSHPEEREIVEYGTILDIPMEGRPFQQLVLVLKNHHVCLCH
jgi:hypothetical protein